MALRAIYDSADEIPEDQKDFYTEKNGKFVLDVESVGGFELSDTTKLRNALSKERTTAKERGDKLKAFEGIDPDEARSAIEKIEEFGDKLEGDSAEKIEALKQQLKTQYEAEKSRLTETFEKERKTYSDQIGSLTGQLEEELIVSQGSQEIAAQQGAVQLLLPVIQRRTKVSRNEDTGKFELHVLDDKGNVRLGSDLNNMTLKEFVSELKSDKTFSRAFDAMEVSGTGSKPSGSGSNGRIVLSTDQMKDPENYRRAVSKAQETGQQIEFTE